MTVAELDALPEPQAAEALAACCGSSRWVTAMLVRRPFRRAETLLAAAAEAWTSLGPDDWREAFARHPRIGERQGVQPQSERGQAWSAHEQAGVDSADARVRQELAVLNHEYERRFGFIYIVSAAGKSAEELLALAQRRLENTPEAELAIAVREQQRITQLRLEKLLTPSP